MREEKILDRPEEIGVIYDSPQIIYEGELEVQAGSPGGGPKFPFPWDM